MTKKRIQETWGNVDYTSLHDIIGYANSIKEKYPEVTFEDIEIVSEDVYDSTYARLKFSRFETDIEEFQREEQERRSAEWREARDRELFAELKKKFEESK